MIPKLEHVCDSSKYRPHMHYVCIDAEHKKDGLWATATDGHMLIRWNASDEFTEEETEHLAGKMIHKTLWKQMAMARKGHPRCAIDEAGIHLHYPYPHLVKWGTDYAVNGHTVHDMPYPNWKAVLKNYDAKSSIAGLSIPLIAKLNKVFGIANGSGRIVLRMHAPDKPIYGIIEGDTTNALVVIMPLMISESGQDWDYIFRSCLAEHGLQKEREK